MKTLGVAVILCMSWPAWGDYLPASTSSYSTEDQDKAQVEADVSAITKYVYNVYYDYDRSVNDGVFEVKPTLAGHTKPNFISFDYNLSGDDETFATQAIQSHFDYDGKANMYINKTGSVAWRLGADYDSFSDPSPTETFGRIPRIVNGASAGVHIKTDKGNSVDASLRAYQENFTIPNIVDGNILDNQGVDAVVQYNNAFLPETSWILRASGGVRDFPNKTVPADTLLVPKNDSVYASVESGFVGRLSENTSIDSAVGWLVRNYSDDTEALNPAYISDSYSSPIFYMRFLDQLTRRDQFMVGYNYTVGDSYYTNYYLDEEIYLGIVRIIGDQILFLTRMAYDYRSYSLPNRRDDEKITVAASLRYSLSKNLKLTADLRLDLLSSDVYDDSEAPLLISPDRPASYNAGSLGIGILATF